MQRSKAEKATAILLAGSGSSDADRTKAATWLAASDTELSVWGHAFLLDRDGDPHAMACREAGAISVTPLLTRSLRSSMVGKMLSDMAEDPAVRDELLRTACRWPDEPLLAGAAFAVLGQVRGPFAEAWTGPVVTFVNQKLDESAMQPQPGKLTGNALDALEGAVRVLEWLSGPEVLEALKRALHCNEFHTVSDAAYDALARKTTEMDPSQSPLSWLRDWEAQVSQASADELLAELLRLHDAPGRGFYLGTRYRQARHIGRRLYTLGGHPQMLATGRAVQDARGSVRVSGLESAWDGIGQWQH